ncbi:MAG: prepilin-type N-terminal cleavage/methylation domain-containing protein [Sedimentisphaerales bacterium]|nr:prepilin-type N-terminal cleavage/methylation domain-containing protein [Sedimentisphaerales bacterium]
MKRAFTLIELLVVISIITLLLSIAMPAFNAARAGTMSLVCKTNIHQLLLANISYASENDGYFVAAASDMMNGPGLNRWHGTRNSIDEPFDSQRGPLAGYLGNSQVKECPLNVTFVKDQNWSTNFEQGCGGYGYNMTYIGSRLWQRNLKTQQDWLDAYAKTTRIEEIKKSAQTLMFSDTAMGNDGENLIEYSFAEPPFALQNGVPVTSFYMSPSIHFRHNNNANVGWTDGHISNCKKAKFEKKNAYDVSSSDLNLGWFDPIDNSPFDLK